MRTKIEKLYKQAQTENTSMLPINTSYTWWSEYEDNYSIFDRYLLDTFRSFYYWVNFTDDETSSEILADFKSAVSSFLAVNQKRYAELYRVHTLENSAYDIVNNYSVTETKSGTYTDGQRSDSISETHNNTLTEGARTDTESATHSNEITEGSRTDTENVTQGAQTNTDTTNLGAKEDTNENQISAFNSTSYQDSDYATTNYGAQTNSNTSAIGSRTDEMSSVKGAQINTDEGMNSITNEKGQQANTDIGTTANTTIKGEQTNTDSYTLTRAGNIGVQTPADVIGGHLDLWDRFNFFKQIFDEIAIQYFVCQNRYYE